MLRPFRNFAQKSNSSNCTAVVCSARTWPYTKWLNTQPYHYSTIRQSGQLSTSKLQLLCPYSLLLVLDLECTCIDKRNTTVEQSERHIDEIIEIAVALYNVHNQCIEHTFHHYVQCTQPITQYCTALTGISQVQLNHNGFSFTYVWYKLHEWLHSNNIINTSGFQSVARQCHASSDNPVFSLNHRQSINVVDTTIVTVGSTDLQQFIPNQLAYCNIQEPTHNVFNKYIDLALIHKKHQLKTKNKRHTSHYSAGLNAMLAAYNVIRVGNAHSAMDDVKTTCNLVTAMLHDNVVFTNTAVDGRQIVQ